MKFGSGAEVKFWFACQRLDKEFATMDRQHEVPREWLGYPYSLDFAFPGIKLGIEIDGYKWHAETTELFTDHIKRHRYIEWHQGWRLIRFTGTEITTIEKVDECAAEVLRVRRDLKRRTP